MAVPLRLVAVVAATLMLACLPASAAIELSVESYGATQVVSGTTAVTVTGVAAPDSYVVIRADGSYVSAIGSPFSYLWDTRQVKDGQVTLAAVEVNADGAEVSSDSVTVRVENSASVPGPVTLEWGVASGDVVRTSITGTADLIDAITYDHKYAPIRLVRALACTISGSATDTVADLVDDGSLVVNRQLDSLVADYQDRVVELAGSAQPTSVSILPNGTLGDGPEKGVVQARAGMTWLPLPSKPVNVDDQWQGDLIVLQSAQTGSVRKEPATHEIVGWANWRGETCAIVESRLRFTDDMVVQLPSGDTSFRMVKSVVIRLSFFSLDSGRVLHVEETTDRMIGVEAADWGVGPESFIPLEDLESEAPSSTQPGGMLGGTVGGPMTGGPMVGGPMMGSMGGYGGLRQPVTEQERVPESLDLVYRIKLVVDVES